MKHLKGLTLPRRAIEPRNPLEAVWFFILDLLGKPRPQ